MKNKMIHWIMHKPKTVLFLVATFVLLALPLLNIAVHGFHEETGFKPPIVELKSDFGYRIWFRPDDPELKEFDVFERRFGNDEVVVLILHSAEGIFNSKTAKHLIDLTEDLKRIPEVIRVDSLSNYQWVHAEGDDIQVEDLISEDILANEKELIRRREIAIKHEVIPDYLLARDAKTAIFFATLKPAIQRNSDGKIITTTPNYDEVINGKKDKKGQVQLIGVRELIKKYEKLGNYEIHMAGSPVINQSFREVTQQDLSLLLPLIVLSISILLFIIFRRLSGILLALFIVFMSLYSTLNIAVVLGIQMNNITTLLPMLLLAVGVANAVHILTTYYRLVNTLDSRLEALTISLKKNFVPTLVTSITTCAGFLSFATAPIVPISHLGILAGVGTLLAWLFTYFALGPICVLLPIKAKSVTESLEKKKEARAHAFTGWVTKNAPWINYSTGFLCVAALFLTLQNNINSDPYTYFADDVPLKIASDFMEEHVGGVSAVEIVVDSGEPEGIKSPEWIKKVEEYQNWISAQSHITKTTSVVDIIKQTNRALNGGQQSYYRLPDERNKIAQYLFFYTSSLPPGMDINDRMSLKNDAIRLTARSNIHDSTRFMKFKREFEKKAEDLGLDAHITGKLPLYQEINGLVVKSFIRSVTLAILVISLILSIVFRSIKLGLIALIPNLVPLIMGGAVLKLLDINLDIGTVLVTSICLGIAVDDTIHFLSHYRGLSSKGHSSFDSITHILNRTAPALIITTIILVMSFALLMLGSFVPNINFGIMVASILSMALLSDLIFLPALMHKLNIKFK